MHASHVGGGIFVGIKNRFHCVRLELVCEMPTVSPRWVSSFPEGKKTMVSETNIRIHSAADSSFFERRIVDTRDLRLAEFTVDSQPSCIGIVRDRLMESFDEFGISPESGTTQFCMALEEALANAFYHGNLELDSSLKEDGSDQFSQLARERCQKSPWKDRQVSITELATPMGIWISISDEGSGFDVQSALERANDPLSMLASGRGLVMMRAFTDELVFNPRGNEVTLVVYHNKNQDVAELLRSRAKSRQMNDESERH